MKTVFRMEKVKSTQQLMNRCKHVYDISEIEACHFKTKYLNKVKPIYTLIGSESNAYSDIKKLKEKYNIECRANSPKAIEMIFSLSPDFFESDKKERIKIFANQTLKYLSDSYGAEKVAHVVLHLHEDTPHIHAFVVPWQIQTKRGRYDCAPYNMIKTKEFTPEYLSQQQKKYWSLFEGFGLEPLNQHSKYKRTDLKDHYIKSIQAYRISEENNMKKTNSLKLETGKIRAELENEKTIRRNIENEAMIANENFKKLLIEHNKLKISFEKLKSNYNKMQELITNYLNVKTIIQAFQIIKKKESSDFESDLDFELPNGINIQCKNRKNEYKSQRLKK